MKYILEYKIWDLFKKKKNPTNWDDLALKLIEYYITNDIPIQVEGSFGTGDFPYKLVRLKISEVRRETESYVLWTNVEFNKLHNIDDNFVWHIKLSKSSRQTNGILNGHQMVGVVYIYNCSENIEPNDKVYNFISDESFTKGGDLYRKQLYKWDIFLEIFNNISNLSSRIYKSIDNEFEDPRNFWSYMNNLNTDYSFFKYPNIINWHRYIDCVISESRKEIDKDDQNFDIIKDILKKRGFKII